MIDGQVTDDDIDLLPWPQGSKVHVTRGTHAGKRGDVLRFDAEHERLYLFVKGGGAISVPTSFCKREGK